MLCFNDGYIETFVSGGVSPYVYDWSNGGSDYSIDSLYSGNYSLVVYDFNKCSDSLIFIISEPTQLYLNTSSVSSSCEGASDGYIDIDVYGGVSPYIFLWSNNENTEDLYNIITGSYYVLVTDNNNCLVSDSIYVGFNDNNSCFFVPTGFTPNGDGIHDNWVIDGVFDYPNMIVKVYNRWGQLMFVSQGDYDPWDGTFEGSNLPIATYYYIIDFNNGEEPIKGNVTIKR